VLKFVRNFNPGDKQKGGLPMTPGELYETPLDCMSNYSKVSYPHRAPVLAEMIFKMNTAFR
jgi:hypothetical protein